VKEICGGTVQDRRDRRSEAGGNENDFHPANVDQIGKCHAAAIVIGMIVVYEPDPCLIAWRD
jgi:hypothetical protein